MKYVDRFDRNSQDPDRFDYTATPIEHPCCGGCGTILIGAKQNWCRKCYPKFKAYLGKAVTSTEFTGQLEERTSPAGIGEYRRLQAGFKLGMMNR